MSKTQASVFTLMVDNEFGVLTRITAWIRRAGWNIRSLAVAETASPEISRLTISLECRHNTLEHVLERLNKLDCVREITPYSPENQVAMELALVRVETKGTEKLLELCQGFQPKLLEENGTGVILSLVGQQEALDQLMGELGKQWSLELARTGTISLMRHKK